MRRCTGLCQPVDNRVAGSCLILLQSLGQPCLGFGIVGFCRQHLAPCLDFQFGAAEFMPVMSPPHQNFSVGGQGIHRYRQQTEHPQPDYFAAVHDDDHFTASCPCGENDRRCSSQPCANKVSTWS